MDNIKYTIVKFDKTLGQIMVKFEDWHITPIDLPLNSSGLFITGEVLDKHIKMHYPSTAIERRKLLQVGIANTSEIEALVDTSEQSTQNSSPIVDLFTILK